MRTFLIGAAMAGAIATPAAAQGRGIAVEGIGGWTGFADESVIHHGVIGGRARVPLTGRISIGPEVLYMQGPDVDRDILLQATMTIDFTRGRGAVTPYFIATGGLMWHRSEFGFGPDKPGLQRRWMRGGYGSGGLGLRGRVADRVDLGVEGRIGFEISASLLGTVSYRLR